MPPVWCNETPKTCRYLLLVHGPESPRAGGQGGPGSAGDAPVPEDEQARLDALGRYAILDSSPEEAFDDLARLAAHICGTPIAVVNLVDADRSWSKANLGLLVRSVPREESFCAWAIGGREPFVVTDATADPRFANLPMVVSDPSIRSYAGAPLVTSDGHALGTLAVMDRAPRTFSTAQLAALTALSRQVMTQLELQLALSSAQRTAAEQSELSVALREAEERFRSLVETMPAVVYLDAYNDASSAVYISPQVEGMLGYAPEEWLAHDDLWREILHPEDREKALRDVEDILASDKPWRLEYRMIAKDGHEVWVHDEAVVVRDTAGRPLFWQGIWLDITEQRETRGALAVSEAKYKALVEQLPAVTYLDPIDEDADSIYISPQVEQLIGGKLQDWLTSPNYWASRVYPDDLDRVWDTYVHHRETGEPLQQEYRMVRDDGRIIWVREQARILTDDDGNPWLIQGLIHDITSSRQGQEEISKALSREKAAVERLQRLDEVKNTLLHAVSHDLRGPITSMLGSAVTLERDESGISPEDRKSLVRGLASSARKMHRIVNDLLDMDRIERGIVEPHRFKTDVGALVRRVVEELGFATDRPIELDADGVVVAVDGPKVERIVENLLANTARHTPTGTQVWVRSHAYDSGVLISVEDTGPGVPRELWETIFEPFKQGSGQTNSPGVGIGLSLVERFAKLHGGQAWVADRDGGGASFNVYLPDGPVDHSTFPPVVLDPAPTD